jgi:hypothetical protein
MSKAKQNKNNNSKGGGRNHSQIMSLKKEIHGCKLKPAAHPPEFTSRPWYELTVRMDNAAASVTAVQVATSIANQLFGAVQPIFFRLQSVKVWGPLPSFTAGPLQQISVAILDPLAQNITLPTQRVLEQYTRYPDQVQRASIGYKYPIAQSDLVITGGDNALLSATGLGPGSVIYWRVLWRSGAVTPAADPSSVSKSFWPLS